MQSTKDESRGSNGLETSPTVFWGSASSSSGFYASSKALMLSTMQTEMEVPVEDEGPEVSSHVFLDKVAVVMLVAAGTVCLLTNSLVLALLMRQRGRLCLRYRLVRSQAIVGVITAFVVAYPLKVKKTSKCK